jgi:hypothetical protein
MNVGFFKDECKNRKKFNVATINKKIKINNNQICESSFRYNKFHLYTKFKMLRVGIDLEFFPDKCKEILTEQHLYIFCNDDPYIIRSNVNTPKYIGVLKINGEFYYPLIDDFKKIYSERQDFDLCWTMIDLDDNFEIPYWVDNYATKRQHRK